MDSLGLPNGTCFVKDESSFMTCTTSLRKCHTEHVNPSVLVCKRGCGLLGQLPSMPSTILMMTYIKRRDSILRKAADLSMLSDSDVGLLMFSPTGQLTSFASNGRVEDIFLHFLDWCDEHGEPLENEEYLRKSLKRLKYEAEMLDKIGRIQELEKELSDLNRKKYKAEEKLRSYNPDMIQTLSIPEAYQRQQIVMDALERIEKLKHAKLLEKEISPSNSNDLEMPALEMGSSSAATEATNSETQRNQLPDDHNGKNIEELEPSTS